MDLSLFQIDYAQTWIAFFLNADKTLYGRYGSRTTDAEPLISLEGFRRALEGALEIHRNYPANKSSLKGKGPRRVRYRTPVQMGLKGTPEPYIKWYSCIHCHEVQIEGIQKPRRAGKVIPDRQLWTYPLPDWLGLVLDPRERAKVKEVVAGSSAKRDGFKVGDEIVSLEGQPIISIADVQWVLEHAPGSGRLKANVRRNGIAKSLTMSLPKGWRRNGDFSWRHFSNRLRPRFFDAEDLTPVERRGQGLSDRAMAIRVRGVWQNVMRAGLKTGDLIVEADGRRTGTFSEFLAYIAQKKRPGDKLIVKARRGGREVRLSLEIP